VRRYWVPVTAGAFVIASLSVGLYVANRQRLVNGNSRVYKIQAIGNGSDGIDSIGLVSEQFRRGNAGTGSPVPR